MDLRVLITDSALADLREIIQFIARDDKTAAIKVGEKLIAGALSLSKFALRCPIYDKERGIRKMVLPPYLVFYTCDETASVVNVLHIWHGARNPPEFQ